MIALKWSIPNGIRLEPQGFKLKLPILVTAELRTFRHCESEELMLCMAFLGPLGQGPGRGQARDYTDATDLAEMSL